MSSHPKTDLGANTLLRRGAKPQTAADNTFIVGATIDRDAIGMPQTAVAFAIVKWTAASGAGGATNTLTLKLEQSDSADFASPTDYDSDTYVYTWAADGDNEGAHALPLDLRGAKQYVRVSAKLVEDGTVTVSAQEIASGIMFGGHLHLADPAYAAAGYEDAVNAA